MVEQKKKKSQPMSIRIEKSIAERLSDFCEKSGQSKTTAIERALIAYIDNYDAMMERISEIKE